MHSARSIAAFTTALVACSPYSKSETESANTAVLVPANTATVAKTATAAAVPPKSPYRYTKVKVMSSLEDALVQDLGKEIGTPLSQIAMRVLVWWVDVRKDLRKGDQIELVFESKDDILEPLVLHAIWLKSQKLGTEMAAVQYQATGQQFSRWYLEGGDEVELRMEDCPLDTYEQVTSLLNDGRRHKGVDFKCPVGTPVRAPFDGVIVAKNWGRRNGNCLEIQASKTGWRAKLLHLDRIEPGIGVGTRVKSGQVIAQSGNTGHSTAPHLHYQLEQSDGGRLLDPFKVHKTYRAKLPVDEIEKARAALAKFAQLRT